MNRRAPQSSSRYNVPNLERGLKIMELLLDFPGGLSQSDIAARLRCSKTSVYRISMTLTDYGYLVRDEETKILRLSRKLVAMGSRTLTEADLMTVSAEIMKDLRDKVRETVLIGTVAETALIVLGQVLGTHPFKFSVDLGARLPLHTAAPGKAILASLPAKERDEIISKIRFIRFNERTVCDVREYRDQLEQASMRGYALDLGEQLAGIHCVAAPVFNRHGYPVASVWTTGPTERMPQTDLPKVGSLVKEQAGLISGRLGFGALQRNESGKNL